ncbi:MAG: hypothetical protein AAF802_03395 [Planctomycetota bacterium]
MPRVSLVPFAALAAALLAVSSSNAQTPETHPLPDRIKNHFDRFVGTWDYSHVENGQTYSGVWTVKWSKSHAGIVSEFDEEGPDGHISGNLVDCWDPSTNEIVGITISDKLGYRLVRYRLVSENLVKGSGTSIRPDGSKQTAEYRTELGEGEFTWTISSIIENGEVQPDLSFKFVRREPSSNLHLVLPEHVLSHFEYIDGTWDYEYESEGKIYQGVFTSRLNSVGNAIISRFDEDSERGRFGGTTLTGWDPKAEKLVSSDVIDNRGCRQRFFKFTSKDTLVGNGLDWTTEGDEVNAELTFQRTEKGFIYKIKRPEAKGRPASERVLTFRRPS